MRILSGCLGLMVLAGCFAVTSHAQQRPTLSSKGCAFEEIGMMAFGTYDTGSDVPVDVQGRISYTCGKQSLGGSIGQDSPRLDTIRQQIFVQISLSAGSQGTFNRSMWGTHDRLRYNLYLDPQRTQVWGDGTGGTRTYDNKAKPNGHPIIVPVYGRVFGAQDVSADVYLDRIIVTMDF